LDNIEFQSITHADNIMLIKDIEDTKIKEAINDCGSEKSPGPDGFNFSFIKENWETIKRDLIQVVKGFQQTGEIPRGYNASFITLIPKKNNPIDLNEFRPISLVRCIYKVISKVLANRMKECYQK